MFCRVCTFARAGAISWRRRCSRPAGGRPKSRRSPRPDEVKHPVVADELLFGLEARRTTWSRIKRPIYSVYPASAIGESAVSCECALVQQANLPRHFVVVEACAAEFAAGGGEPRAKLGRRGQLDDSRCERRDVAWLHQEASFVVADDFAGAVDVVADHRAGRRARLAAGLGRGLREGWCGRRGRLRREARRCVAAGRGR